MKNNRMLHGIGISDVTIRDVNNYINKSYTKWNDMIRRCYSQKALTKNPTYIGCSVCNEWKYYSNFKLFFDKYYIDGYELDKDILVNGNKIYSPDTCCFIPQYLNKLFTDSAKARGKYKIGVYFDSESNKYKAQMNKYNKNYNIGRYNSEIDAHNAWLIEKRKYCREIAINAYMNNEIDERIMNAIIKKAYELE